MKVCLVTEGELENFNQEKSQNSEIIAFGFEGIKKLSYKKELRGETEELVKIGRLSRDTKSIVVCGTETENYGIKRLSVVVADKGKIVGIADQNAKSENSVYSSGGGYKIINTAIGKIGILVGEDLFCPEAVKSMSLCEADLIIAIYAGISDHKPNIIARAYSLLYGVPICVCAKGFSFATTIKGETHFSSPQAVSVVDVPTKKVYREIVSRQRGINI